MTTVWTVFQRFSNTFLRCPSPDNRYRTLSAYRLFSRVKISSLRPNAHLVLHWRLSNEKNIVSIISLSIINEWFSARICQVVGAPSRGCPITGFLFEIFVIGNL